LCRSHYDQQRRSKAFLAAAAAAAVVLAGGCDRPAPITLPRENPKPDKESFSGFQTSGTPEPLRGDADPSMPTPAQQPTPLPVPTLAPEAQAAAQDYAKALRDLRQDPAARPPDDLDVIQNPGSLQRLNNAIFGHMQQIEDAQDRLRAAKKKEPDSGE
jgi:hypothetical protein